MPRQPIVFALTVLVLVGGCARSAPARAPDRIARPSKITNTLRNGTRVRVAGALVPEHYGIHLGSPDGSGTIRLRIVSPEGSVEAGIKIEPKWDETFRRFNALARGPLDKSRVYHVDLTGVIIKNKPPVNLRLRAPIEICPVIIHEIREEERPPDLMRWPLPWESGQTKEK